MKKKITLYSLLIISVLLVLVLNITQLKGIAKNLIKPELRDAINKKILGKKTIDYYNGLKIKASINYNQKLLPMSEFIELSLKDISLDELINNDENSIQRKFYVEEFNDDLIIIDKGGNIFFINKNVINDVTKFKSVNVKSNLNFDGKEVKDILVINNDIYLSYSEIISSECQNIGIVKAEISKKIINFTNFFKSEECALYFNAGRMEMYLHNNEKGLLYTTDALTVDSPKAQNDNSLYGKILFIDFKNKIPIIFSKGHRVPQGLLVDNNRIISTEHGPRGGDEINFVEFGNNYGWPLASYGEPMKWEKKNDSKIVHYLKNHDENGFIEPIFSFTPSIGIGQIIKVPDKFSEHWKNSYLVASLAGKVIYRVSLDKNLTKINYYEKIFIGKRVRDMRYIEEYDVFVLALSGSRDVGFKDTPQLTNPSIGILRFKDFLYN